MTFFSFGDRLRYGLHCRDRCGEVVISKSEASCGPRHDCQHAMWPPEAHEFDTPDVKDFL